MTRRRALVTGGAGFIGSHIVDGLLARGWHVVAYDNLTTQVHGDSRQRPSYLDPRAELVQADVRDRVALEAAVLGADVIFHHAAAVGVGQSMYDIVDYVDVNVKGTATLCEILARSKHSVKKVVVASSMSIYGEGRYACAKHGAQAPRLRPATQLAARDWEPRCPLCASTLSPLPCDEDKPLQPTSVYATTKRDQEELVLNVGRAYGVPSVALRYFNVYGPRQALSNPYTGVAAIFSSRILNGQPPLVFEDGRQSRDFTHVADIVQANLLALDSDQADGEALNVGTGRRTSLLDLTDMLLDHTGRRGQIAPEVTHKSREGDVRHCYADVSRAREKLGFLPTVPLESGVGALAAWAKGEKPADRVEAALAQLAQHRLVR